MKQIIRARREEVVDNYHGTLVADPYRWLEDPDSLETREWIIEQNSATFAYLDQIEARSKIRERLKQLWNYERYGLPFKQGGQYFIFKNDGLQDQSVLYTMPSLETAPRVLLDPNTLSLDGSITLASVSVSEDGRWLAYSLSKAGSDWRTWRVRCVETGQDLDDGLEWSKFSGATWTLDGLGFFYGSYPEPGDEATETSYFQKLKYHRLRTPQSEDELVYERPDQKEWMFSPEVTEDGKYLVIGVDRGTDPQTQVFYRDLTMEASPIVELITGFDAAYSFIGSERSRFWFWTDLEAPLGRVVMIDVDQPERERWQEVIPESTHKLEVVSLVGGHLIAQYLEDAHSTVRLFDLEGQLVRQLELPGIGSVDGFGGRHTDPETFYSFTTFTSPSTIYRYDVASGESTVFRRSRVTFDPDLYETRQVFFSSRDGTQVPMFIVSPKGIELDGNNPTYLYGYGGFNISLSPEFSPETIAWLELGGVYAVANLRGGGEYGEKWHEAGTKLRRQNVFDDFIAGANWLIENRYTSPSKLGIAGGSNGGLLVGAALTQRPELFGAVIISVGVLDMLRFHKFTIGWAWVSDYGSSEDPEEFRALYAYSPLHNVRPDTVYPATLITTADHDDRVVPAHSFKFAATLQAAQKGSAPVLIRIETDAGHGGQTPLSKVIEEQADEWAFLIRELGISR